MKMLIVALLVLGYAGAAFAKDKMITIETRPGVTVSFNIPVLVMHHERDACVVCKPHEVASILSGLTSAPVKKQITVNGGADPRGEECGALHWHGYIGMEKQAVGIITAWIKDPTS